jgi:hypothetical protein
VSYASARAMQPGLAPLANGSRLCYCSDGKDTCVEDYGMCIQNTNALVRGCYQQPIDCLPACSQHQPVQCPHPICIVAGCLLLIHTLILCTPPVCEVLRNAAE